MRIERIPGVFVRQNFDKGQQPPEKSPTRLLRKVVWNIPSLPAGFFRRNENEIEENFYSAVENSRGFIVLWRVIEENSTLAVSELKNELLSVFAQIARQSEGKKITRSSYPFARLLRVVRRKAFQQELKEKLQNRIAVEQACSLILSTLEMYDLPVTDFYFGNQRRS